MALLTVKGLSKKIQQQLILDDITFSVEGKQKLVITGETGSGKSTLLKIMAGRLQPDAGTIKLNGQIVPGPQEKLLPGHSEIGYLGQHYELLNNYYVHEILSFENNLKPEHSIELYSLCRINHLLQRRTDQLSGGEKQRIALANILVASPCIILLDEPFSNLDYLHKNIIKSVLEDISIKLGITLILVLHEPADTLTWAEKILVLRKGKIIQQGTPAEIYQKPVDEYCATLFGYCNFPNKVLRGKIIETDGMPQRAGQMLIRPEHFRISLTPISLKGIVKNILFNGSHYVLEVLMYGQTVQVQSYGKQPVKGEAIHIYILPEDIHYI